MKYSIEFCRTSYVSYEVEGESQDKAEINAWQLLANDYNVDDGKANWALVFMTPVEVSE